MLSGYFDRKVPSRTGVTHCLPLNATNAVEEEEECRRHGAEVLGANLEAGHGHSSLPLKLSRCPTRCAAERPRKGKTRRSRDPISLSNYLLPVSHLLPGKMSRAKSGGQGTALWKHRWDREHGGVRATGQKPVSHALPLEEGRKIHLYHHGEEADSTLKQL